jgi:hypothetical protein
MGRFLVTFPFLLGRAQSVRNNDKLLLNRFLKHADRGCFRFDLLDFGVQMKVFRTEMIEGESWRVKKGRGIGCVNFQSNFLV